MERRRFLTVAASGLGWSAGCVTRSGFVGGDAGTETGVPTTDASPEYVIKATGVPIYHYALESWFDPVGLYVPLDTTVTWIHTGDGAPAHQPIAYQDRIPSGATRFASRSLTEGETFEYTFSVRGTYDYYCGLHRSEFDMVGRVVCEEPGGPAEESANPHGELPSSEVIVEMGVVPHEYGSDSPTEAQRQ